MAGHPDRWAVVVIIAVAAVIRMAFAPSAPPFLNPDSEGYYLPAHDLVAGRQFQPDLRRTPTYPLFIAAVIALLGEDLQTLVTVQHALIGPTTAVLAYLLGRLLTARLVALVAALLVAVCGTLLLYEHYVLTEALFTPLLLAVLVSVILAARRASIRWAVVGGVLLGAAILCRPAAQTLAPILAGALLLGSGTLRRRATLVALCGVSAAVVVVPWMAINQSRHGTFAVSGSGRFLLARTVKNDPGGYSFESPPGLVEDEVRAAARRIVQQEAARPVAGSSAQRLREELGLSEAETSRILSDLAVEAIRKRPAYYLSQSASFAWDILSGTPINIRREGREWKEIDWERRARPVLQRPVYRLDADRAQRLVSVYDPSRYGPLIPILFGAGLVLAAVGLAPRWLLLPGLAVTVLIAGSAALVGPVERYRVPLDPLLTLLSVQAVATAAGLTRVGLRRLRPASRLPGSPDFSPN